MGCFAKAGIKDYDFLISEKNSALKICPPPRKMFRKNKTAKTASFGFRKRKNAFSYLKGGKTSVAYWYCEGNQAMAHLWPGQFLILNSQNNCLTAQFLPTNAKVMATYLECKIFKCAPIPGQQELCIMECLNENNDGDDGGGGDGCNHCECCYAECAKNYNDALKTCDLLQEPFRTECKTNAKQRANECYAQCYADYPGCPLPPILENDPLEPINPI